VKNEIDLRNVGVSTPTFLKPSHASHLPAYEDGTDSVTKSRHIKFRRRGITQKKAYNNQILQTIKFTNSCITNTLTFSSFFPCFGPLDHL